MFALARDIGPVGNRDQVMTPQPEIGAAPLVPDDVPCPLAVNRPVTLIVAECPRIEVGIAKVLPELLWEPDLAVARQRIAPRVKGSPNSLVACASVVVCLIAQVDARNG